MTVKPFFSIWIQLSSLCFHLAGQYSDLLIIRLFLSGAYVFLFLNSILGAPLWPLWRQPGYIQIDGIFWATLNLYVHVSTVVRLLLDERPVQLRNEPLWRLFYRTGGLSQKLFSETIDPYCLQIKCNKDDVIPLDDDVTGNRQWFYIIYSGKVNLTVVAFDDKKNIVSSTNRVATSGQLFDFRSMGLLKDAGIARHSRGKHRLQSAVALTDDVRLFRFHAVDMENKIACHPVTRLMWKELLMENLLRIVQRHFYQARHERIHEDYEEDDINPIFAELRAWEQPDALAAGSGRAFGSPIRHIFKTMRDTFTPPWPIKGFPTGLRHKLPAPNRRAKNAEKKRQPKTTDVENGEVETTPLLLVRRETDQSQVMQTVPADADFLQYLDGMDEKSGLGLHISFIDEGN